MLKALIDAGRALWTPTFYLKADHPISHGKGPSPNQEGQSMLIHAQRGLCRDTYKSHSNLSLVLTPRCLLVIVSQFTTQTPCLATCPQFTSFYISYISCWPKGFFPHYVPSAASLVYIKTWNKCVSFSPINLSYVSLIFRPAAET